MAAHKARIRSIKPEFWTDPTIAELPKATALFFIALWNFASDQGVLEDEGLHLRIPIFRSQDIEKMLCALHHKGLIYRSRVDGLVMVRGWAHQKIDKPTAGKWNPKDIEWITHDGSTITLEGSATGGDRKGEDRKGGEGSASPAPQATPEDSLVVEERARREGEELEEAVEYYCEQYRARAKTQLSPKLSAADLLALPKIYELVGKDLRKLKRVINAYFYSSKTYYESRGWPLTILEEDFNAIAAKAAA